MSNIIKIVWSTEINYFMKNCLSLLSFTSILIVLALQSCTIEKRRYTAGYHIDLHKSKDHKNDESINDLTINESTSISAEIFDSSKVCGSTIVVLENEEEGVDSIIPNVKMFDIEIEDGPEVKMEKSKSKNILSHFLHFQPTAEIKFQQESDDGKVGIDGVLSWIAFAFAVLSIALVILATVVNGWAGLGYIAMALFAGVLTAVMAIIAKIVSDRKQNPTRWHLWFALAVGAIWAIITLSILFSRG